MTQRGMHGNAWLPCIPLWVMQLLRAGQLLDSRVYIRIWDLTNEKQECIHYHPNDISYSSLIGQSEIRIFLRLSKLQRRCNKVNKPAFCRMVVQGNKQKVQCIVYTTTSFLLKLVYNCCFRYIVSPYTLDKRIAKCSMCQLVI